MLLEGEALDVRYGRTHAVKNVSVQVQAGEAQGWLRLLSLRTAAPAAPTGANGLQQALNVARTGASGNTVATLSKPVSDGNARLSATRFGPEAGIAANTVTNVNTVSHTSALRFGQTLESSTAYAPFAGQLDQVVAGASGDAVGAAVATTVADFVVKKADGTTLDGLRLRKRARKVAEVGGVVTVRSQPAKRLFWRDLHAVTGIFAGGVIVFLAVTGMPWSAFWGKEVRQITTQAGWGRPKPPVTQTSSTPTPTAIIVDGTQGVVIVDPDEQVLAEYQLRQHQFDIEPMYRCKNDLTADTLRQCSRQ